MTIAIDLEVAARQLQSLARSALAQSQDIASDNLADFAHFKLCYVNRSLSLAWFTSNPEQQWGDDWDDAPADCNAGHPYEPSVYHYSDGTKGLRAADWLPDGTPRWQLLVVGFYVPDVAVDSDTERYSVQDINQGRGAWLAANRAEQALLVRGGVALPEFVAALETFGGEVLLPRRGLHQMLFPKPMPGVPVK